MGQSCATRLWAGGGWWSSGGRAGQSCATRLWAGGGWWSSGGRAGCGCERRLRADGGRGRVVVGRVKVVRPGCGRVVGGGRVVVGRVVVVSRLRADGGWWSSQAG